MRAQLVGFLFLAALPLFAAELVRNGTMETDENGNGVADGWSLNIHQGAEGTVELVPRSEGQEARCQHVVHTNASSEWVRVSQEPIPAVPGHLYALSAEVRGRGRWQILLYEFVAGGTYQTHSIASGQDTAEWTRVGKTVRVGENATHFKISLVTLGEGEAWFDNVSLRDVSLPPALRLPRLSAAPEIDGQLDDPVWAEAAATGDFFLLGQDGALPTAPVEARIGFYDGALCVAWTCAEPRLAEQKTSNPASWNDDTVEVFLMPPQGGGYVHVGLTPAGGQLQDSRQLPGGGRYAVDWFSTKTTGAEGQTKLVPPAWQSAVRKGEKEWTGEMRIPLAEVAEPRGIWHLQLARSRKVGDLEENSCWSLTPGATFHVPEQFGLIALPATGQATAKPIPPPAVQPPQVVRVVPLPQRVVEAGKHTVLPTRLTVAGTACQPVADQLVALLRDRYTVTAQVGAEGPIVLDLAANWQPENDTPLTDWQLAEAYELDTRSLPIQLRARTPQGLRYAMQTLRQLLTRTADGLAVNGMLVVDWPLIQWRGWHLIGPETGAALPEARRVIETMAGLKMNWVAIQIDNRLRYERDPDLSRSADATTKQELRELVALAESWGMEVIPMTQCLSHFSYFLGKENYRRFAEVQEPDPKARWKYWNYCPRHPEVHEQLVFPLIEEQLECFPHAKYFHVGMDEITFEPIGVCPRCQGTPGGELLAEEINRLHEFLKAKGLRMCMWGDQLLVEHNGKPPYNTAEALPKMPRDIIIFDWHYGAQESFPSLPFFKQQGFEVIASGWYEPQNVTEFAWETKQNELLGYGGTTWFGIDRIRNEIRLATGIPLSAEFAWSPRQPALGDLGFEPAAVFRAFYDDPAPAPAAFLPIDLSGSTNRRLADNEDRTGWLGLGPDYDLSALPTGQQWLASVPFAIPAKGPQCIVLARNEDPNASLPTRAWQIPVGAAVKGFAFLQTCEHPDRFSRHIYDRQKVNPGQVASYTIYYADGHEVTLPIRWNQEIADWNSQLGAGRCETAWEGQTRGGAQIRLGVYRWTNPRPEVPIESIDFVSGGDKVRPVLIALTAWQ